MPVDWLEDFTQRLIQVAKDKKFNVEIYMEQEMRQNLTEIKCRIPNQVGSYTETIMCSKCFLGKRL